ncbi:alpha/beta hydrolase family protein [Alicyclobacillus macrosporangiidus]|uniref:alpha/beta hydrolase family protein n=1 Tax=Alicyclobacillus macrosporangiidus TaxID=392015 RepID=UPI00055279A2|nr:alpha/beta hydrolase family protein [Alicyclobacillus macrosporangiidus]
MAKRHFSLQEYFIRRGLMVKPKLHFDDDLGQDVLQWQTVLRAKLMELMEPFPQEVELHPETVWQVEKDGLYKEKVIFDVEELASVPALVIKRTDLPKDARHPAVLCLHGHGPEGDWHAYGKDLVTGVATDTVRKHAIQRYNYDYAVQLARAGFITVTLDFRNFGERSDGNLYPGRDSCNVHFIRGLLMGVKLITLHVWDVMKTVDYLVTRPDVDPDAIGCVGLSFGGTMALHVAALDTRIKAASVSCALTTYMEYAIKLGNFCGSQFVPGIYEYADLSDLAGLIAPRPLLVENGVHDPGFPIEASLAAQKHLRSIYRAAGASERLFTHVFDGAHRFSGDHTVSFLNNWLRGRFCDEHALF